MSHQRERWLVWSLVAAVALLSAAGSYSAFRAFAPDRHASGGKQAGVGSVKPLAGSVGQVAPAAPVIVSEGAILDKKVFFSYCRHEVDTQSAAGQEFIGHTEAELKELYPEASISVASPLRVVWRETKEDFCPEHGSQRYLGVNGDRVAVFQGLPGMRPVVLDQTDIPVEWMPDGEVRRLRQGIIVRNDDELNEMLQGLASISGQ